MHCATSPASLPPPAERVPSPAASPRTSTARFPVARRRRAADPPRGEPAVRAPGGLAGEDIGLLRGVACARRRSPLFGPGTEAAMSLPGVPAVKTTVPRL